MSRLLVLANEATAAQRRVYFHLVDAGDGMTPETGEAAGQPQVSSDGAAWTNTGIGTLSAIGNGRYSADLTQTLVLTAGTLIETRYKSANTAECPGDSVQVVAFDPNDTVRLGLTALPAAAADAAGGLPISDAGGLDLDAKLANTNEVTAARMAALTDWINGGRLDLILDIIAADTTTDIPALIAALNNLSNAQLVSAIASGDDATLAAIATAQADLDLLTGVDGATLATLQANYAPAKATDVVSGGAITTSGGAVSTVTTTTTATNLTNAPTNGDLTATMKASVNAEVLDVLATDTHAEPSAAPAATSTLKDKINWIFCLMRNKREQTSTTETLRADNGSTAIATSTKSDDATTATRGEWT